MTSMVCVAVVNYTSLHDDDVASGIAALQAQVSDDLVRAWGVDAELVRLQPVESRANVYGLILMEQYVQGATYPEATTHGLPLANVFLSDLAKGQDWTQAASRELLDLLVNPIVSGVVYRQFGHGDAERHLAYLHDVTAPCAAYDNGYEKGERQVADFVHRSWFSDREAADYRAEFDQRGRIRTAFGILGGERVYAYDLAMDQWRVFEADRATGDVRESAAEPTGIRVQRFVNFMKEHRVRVNERRMDGGYPGGP